MTFEISVRYISVVEERRGEYRVLVRKPEVKRPLGRYMRRWEDSIKVVLQEVGWGMDWLDPAQNSDI
jgi:hypothetical protein